MTRQKPPKSAPRSPRNDRLGAALRENLKRRKAQAKGRAKEAGEGTESEAPQAPNSAGFPNHKRTGNA
jgi:hypothetical protein